MHKHVRTSLFYVMAAGLGLAVFNSNPILRHICPEDLLLSLWLVLPRVKTALIEEHYDTAGHRSLSSKRLRIIFILNHLQIPNKALNIN